MSRTTNSIISIAAVAACVAPSSTNSAAAPSTREVEERDVAAAIATYTVRAYQPVIVAADTAAYTSLPSLANVSAPVRVVANDGNAYTTIVGPYRDHATGEAKVTRISVRTEGGRQVASYYTRTLGGGTAERGEYAAQPALKVVAN